MRNRNCVMPARWPCIVAAMLLAALLSGCGRSAPDDAIRARVAALEAAIESRDAGAVVDVLDDDFIGPQGMDRRDARRLAAALMLRHQRIKVVSGPLQVTLQGENRATVRTQAALSGRDGNALLPDAARAWRIESGWRLRGGEWRITSLSWTPALE